MAQRNESGTSQARDVVRGGGGALLAAAGLVGDSLVGGVLVAGGSLWWLVAHLAAVPLWALGITLLTTRLPPTVASEPQRITHARWLRLDGRTISMSVLSLTIFPGMGVLACTLVVLLDATGSGRRDQRRAAETQVAAELDPLLTWHATLDPEADLAVQPLVDVLDSPDVDQRRAAIDALGRQGRAEAVLVLRRCLTDPSPDVRGDASVTLARLEHEFVQALSAAQTRMRAQPAASGHYAEVCYRYAHSGLLEDTISRYYLIQAREALERAIAAESMETRWWLLLTRVQMDLDAPEAAIEALSYAIAHGEQNTEVRLLRLETALQAGNVSGMLALARCDVGDLETPRELNDLLAWWSEAK